jgi:hypothetical protein
MENGIKKSLNIFILKFGNVTKCNFVQEIQNYTIEIIYLAS